MCACGVQKEVPDQLELELQVVMRFSVWVLGTKLGSSEKAVHVFNCLAISSAPALQYSMRKRCIFFTDVMCL